MKGHRRRANENRKDAGYAFRYLQSVVRKRNGLRASSKIPWTSPNRMSSVFPADSPHTQRSPFPMRMFSSLSSQGSPTGTNRRHAPSPSRNNLWKGGMEGLEKEGMPFLRKALPSPIPNPATASYTCSTSPSTLLRTAALCLRWMMKADAALVRPARSVNRQT